MMLHFQNGVSFKHLTLECLLYDKYFSKHLKWTLFWGALKSLQMVTAAMKLKRHLLLGRKVMTNLDSIFKSRDITLPTKVHLVKAMVFTVVMYGCESWTIKKAECWRINASELWCWRRLLRVDGLQGDPTSPSKRRSVLGVHWKDWCWSWNSNPLATWCEELTHLKRPWCWEGLGAGRRRGRQRMRSLDGITDSMDMGLVTPAVGDGQGGLVCCGSWGHKESDTTEWLNWTDS